MAKSIKSKSQLFDNLAGVLLHGIGDSPLVKHLNENQVTGYRTRVEPEKA